MTSTPRAGSPRDVGEMQWDGENWFWAWSTRYVLTYRWEEGKGFHSDNHFISPDFEVPLHSLHSLHSILSNGSNSRRGPPLSPLLQLS